MPKTINIEYTNPATGAQATKQVSIDIERYRKDTEQGAVESFFLKATASGCRPILESIDDLIADLLDGRPSGRRYGVVQAYIDTAFTANGDTLSVTPNADDAGFVAEVPCVVMDKYGHVVDYFIPSAVGDDFTIPTSGLAALGEDCKVGWIVQQVKWFHSPLGENSELGIKAQSEQPSPPTGVSGSGSVSGGINVSYTKSTDAVVKYYDIYCYKGTKPNVIEPNAIPSVADRSANLGSSNVNLTKYFDETTMELKNLDAGTYYVGVVAKDGSGMVDVNESQIAWSDAITIS